MRGKLYPKAKQFSEGGITPADAGKTLSVRLTPSAFQDHPRGCGENSPLRRINSMYPGSPPRMRGKQWADAVNGAAERITPADAGKTKKIL